jgi:hypothetical protein
VKISFLIILTSAMLLASCATKKTSTDGDLDFDPPTKKSAHATGAGAAAATSASNTDSVAVDPSDIALGDRMTKAVDEFVFKKNEVPFRTLCLDDRFSCYVDGKWYPQGKKKLTRKHPPYMSGSKMALQDEKRVQVRYEFFPGK